MSSAQSALLPRGCASTQPNTTTTTLTSGGGSSMKYQSLPPSYFLGNVKISSSQAYESGSNEEGPLKAEWQGTTVAAKKLVELLSYTTDQMLVNLSRELNMLFQLKHPNIVQYYGVHKPSGGYVLELNCETYLLCEFMFCSLDVRNRTKPRLNFRNAVDISQGISNGLQYLHDREIPIVHRDLTTSKILLGSNGIVKISEISYGKIQARSALQLSPADIYTTDIYTAPEVLNGGSFYDANVDVFSFGVVMLELALGRDGVAGEAFCVGNHGNLVQISELERRKSDLEELANHMLKPLIIRCISDRAYRPRASDISRQLLAMKQTHEYKTVPLVSVVSSGPTLNQLPLKELSAKCELLEEKTQVLESDKRLLSDKLDEYIRSEHDERESESSMGVHLDEVDKLMSENAKLQVALVDKDKEIDELSSFSSPPSSLTDTQMRDQRASLMLRINELQLSKRSEIGRLEKRIQALKMENSSLRAELQMLKGTGKSLQQQPSQWVQQTVSSSGPTSLPELSSLTSTTTLQSPTPTGISSLSISHPSLSSSTASSLLSRLTTADSAQTSAEIKQLRKLVDKYKAANIELDKKLKATKLDLQKYDTQHTDTDVLYRMDLERYRSENQHLKAQLDHTLRENSQLKTQLNIAESRQYY